MEAAAQPVFREHKRLDELILELAASRRELLQAVEEAPEWLREERSREGGWTLSQILEHLSVVESGSGRLMGRMLREVREHAVEETSSESVLNSLDRFSLPVPSRRVVAPNFTEPVEGISIEESLQRLKASRERLLQALESVRGLSLSVASAPHPLMGQLDGYGWLLATAQHERRHIFQIRQLANQEHRA